MTNPADGVPVVPGRPTEPPSALSAPGPASPRDFAEPPGKGGRGKLVGWLMIALSVFGCIAIVKMVRDGGGRPGESSVYERIETETDCAILQAEFNAANANHARDVSRGRNDLAEIDRSYMEAADTRMREVRCYR